MKVMKNFSQIKPEKPLALVLGNFDGVHKGHQALIKKCIQEAQDNAWEPCVLTFEPHPSLVLQDSTSIKFLSTLEQKKELMEKLGVKYLFLMPFNLEIAAIEPQDFIKKYLVDLLKVKKIYVGFNYTFGQKGQGTPQLLKTESTKWGYQVYVMEPVVLEGDIVSSTLIREKYAAGKIEEVHRFLGYWPSLKGKVVSGKQRGRLLGYPTANLSLPDSVLLPSYGVYAVLVEGEKKLIPAVANIGTKPTFKSSSITIEVHILDFHENIYDKELKIKLIKKIRPVKCYKDSTELQKQISRDVITARTILSQLKRP